MTDDRVRQLLFAGSPDRERRTADPLRQLAVVHGVGHVQPFEVPQQEGLLLARRAEQLEELEIGMGAARA